MTTTDIDALVDKIEYALWGLTRVYDAPHGGTEVGVHAPVHEVVTAVLPIVAAEVRAAKAEALDEFTRFAERHKDDALTRSASDDEVYRWAIVFTTAWNYLATEHETGDSDEH